MKIKNVMTKVAAFALGVCLLSGCGYAEKGASAGPGIETPETTTAAATTVTGEDPEETTLEETTLENCTLEPSMTIGALKGPTSMGLVSMMEEHPEYAYIMETAADALTASIIKGELDIALVPANVASILYNKTEGGISVIDVNTLSVLYIVASEEGISSVEDLKGKTIYLTGKGTTPDFTLQYLLAANGLSTDDVTLEYKSEATEVATVLSEQPEAIGLLPQPFVTAACLQNENLKVVLSIGEQWEAAQQKVGGTSSQVTGVTIVRNEFLEEYPDLVEKFLTYHAESAAAVNADPAAAAEKIAELGIVAKAPIAQKAIPGCGITCITGEEMRAALEGYLQVLFDQEPGAIGGAMPGDDFYYIAK